MPSLLYFSIREEQSRAEGHSLFWLRDNAGNTTEAAIVGMVCFLSEL